jgi:hypothetical protein
MDGNIFNSSGDHVGRIMGGEIFGLNRDSLGMSHLAANESIVLMFTAPENCPVAADDAAIRCSRTSRISAANDAPTGVSRTERVARNISCTPR